MVSDKLLLFINTLMTRSEGHLRLHGYRLISVGDVSEMKMVILCVEVWHEIRGVTNNGSACDGTQQQRGGVQPRATMAAQVRRR